MVLYDEQEHWKNLLPLTFTRSIAECRVGILTIKEKWEHCLNQKIQIEYCVDYLQQSITAESLRVVSNVLPNTALTKAIKALKENQILIYQNREIGSNNKSEQPEKIEFLEELKFIDYPWQIFLFNDLELRKDYELLTKNRSSHHIPSDNNISGDNIFIEEGAEVHCSILNSNTGPIYIGKNAEVMEGAMIRGPFSLGENAQVKMGAKIYGATTVGKGCKVGGEITNSIFFANSNKAHDGYLGNSVIGEWCNLGADTNSSNLKNNYTPVDIYNYPEQKFISTGQQFLGLIMGDHSKAAINTMFNTGTVVGVSANIVGAGFPNKHIPSFRWCIGEKTKMYDIEKALETIRIVFGRRNKILEDREEKILRHIHKENSN
jgi:UDP-N-acetylglucosamine diphosphorylase/glucosamine-1-phosphate N-acetyltransferase